MTDPSPTRASDGPMDVTIAQARKALELCPCLFDRRIECRFHAGTLELRGRVDCYYHKQLAQIAVSRVDGVERVDNRIEVQQRLNGSTYRREEF